MDNLTAAEQKRLKLIHQIQEMYQSGISIREISGRFQINRQTAKKYLNGDSLVLCRSNKRSSLYQHMDLIMKKNYIHLLDIVYGLAVVVCLYLTFTSESLDINSIMINGALFTIVSINE